VLYVYIHLLYLYRKLNLTPQYAEFSVKAMRGPLPPSVEIMKAPLLLSLLLTAGSVQADSVNFDTAKVGSPPAGWTGTKTGTGEPKWTVERDETAPSKSNVLKQGGQATYPVCIKDDTKLKDGFVQVKFKPVAGKEDQAGGVIWRCQDSNNYFVARANALEDNVTIYHTIGGSRVAFKSVNTKVTSGVWHTLRVDFKGSQFRVTFDGQKVIEASDASFPNAGKIGV
jgi:Domain of Unknown Function (DUF1080)